MMINKRLIIAVKESKKYIARNVICQWASLAANIATMGAIAHMLQSLCEGNAHGGQIGLTAVIAVIAVVIRYVCVVTSSRMRYLTLSASAPFLILRFGSIGILAVSTDVELTLDLIASTILKLGRATFFFRDA